MIIGEFQIAKDGSGANPECTTEPTRIQADVRLDGQLGINIIFSVLDYSGTIKNFGRAAARNPRVSVSSSNAQGALLATEVDDYITDLLGANETATFEIVSSVRPAQLDSTSVLVSGTRQGASALATPVTPPSRTTAAHASAGPLKPPGAPRPLQTIRGAPPATGNGPPSSARHRAGPTPDRGGGIGPPAKDAAPSGRGARVTESGPFLY